MASSAKVHSWCFHAARRGHFLDLAGPDSPKQLIFMEKVNAYPGGRLRKIPPPTDESAITSRLAAGRT